MFLREKYINSITDQLSWVKAKVELCNSISLFDNNIHAESFFCNFLNIVLGYKLKNLNFEEKGHASIDLGDEVNKIAIQVTAEKKRAKIQWTIDSFLKESYNLIYSKLIILIIGDKPKYTKKFNTQGKIDFHEKNDIWDVQYLIRLIEQKSELELQSITDFLDTVFMSRDTFLSSEINGSLYKNSQINIEHPILELRYDTALRGNSCRIFYFGSLDGKYKTTLWFTLQNISNYIITEIHILDFSFHNITLQNSISFLNENFKTGPGLLQKGNAYNIIFQIQCDEKYNTDMKSLDDCKGVIKIKINTSIGSQIIETIHFVYCETSDKDSAVWGEQYYFENI